jgi:hypothetical protein
MHIEHASTPSIFCGKLPSLCQSLTLAPAFLCKFFQAISGVCPVAESPLVDVTCRLSSSVYTVGHLPDSSKWQLVIQEIVFCVDLE